MAWGIFSIISTLPSAIVFFILGIIIASTRLHKNFIGLCTVTILGGISSMFALLLKMWLYPQLFRDMQFLWFDPLPTMLTLGSMGFFAVLSLMAGAFVLPLNKAPKQFLIVSASSQTPVPTEPITTPLPPAAIPNNNTASDAPKGAYRSKRTDVYYVYYLDDIDLDKRR